MLEYPIEIFTWLIFILHGSSIAYFKSISSNQVTWYKDGRQVSPGDKTKFDVTEEDGEFITVELTLESVDESHMGKYRVLVSNELGETEALTSLVING